MKTLYLLRHAKSSWSDPELSDFDRPLNDRGSKAAPFMGTVMREQGFSPELILSSPAVRARQTAELVIGSAPLPGEFRFDERIYEASPQTLRTVVSEVGDDVDSVMLVGHNPGMEGFIRFLTGKTESMPTAALAVIGLRIEKWADIDASSGRLVRVIRPKEHMKAMDASN